jgi:8-oxo-dGTP pyrophosphatase MutT (NUDIX family)
VKRYSALGSAAPSAEASQTGRSAFVAWRNRNALRVLRRYWLVQRGMTLGAQAALIRGESTVLLIRHSYRPGWFFPGGGVERGETFEQALVREVKEEVGATLTEAPRLHGVFANFAVVKRDHIALFVARDWTREGDYCQAREIAEAAMFDYPTLPPDIDPGTLQRLREIFDGAPISAYWSRET